MFIYQFILSQSIGVINFWYNPNDEEYSSIPAHSFVGSQKTVPLTEIQEVQLDMGGPEGMVLFGCGESNGLLTEVFSLNEPFSEEPEPTPEPEEDKRFKTYISRLKKFITNMLPK